MYLSGRIIGKGLNFFSWSGCDTPELEYEDADLMYNKEGRRSYTSSLLLGVNNDHSSFKDTNSINGNYKKSPLAQLLHIFNKFLSSDNNPWSFDYDVVEDVNDVDGALQHINFLYNNEKVCDLPFAIMGESSSGIDFGSNNRVPLFDLGDDNLVFFTLNTTTKNITKNTMVIPRVFYGKNINSYDNGDDEQIYIPTPKTQIEKMVMYNNKHNLSNIQLNSLYDEIDEPGNEQTAMELELKFSMATSIDKNMFIFRIYYPNRCFAFQRGQSIPESYCERSFFKAYELILLKTKINNEDTFLWAQARCPSFYAMAPTDDVHGYSSFGVRDQVQEGDLLERAVKGAGYFFTRNLTAIDWWTFNCSPEIKLPWNNSPYSYTFSNINQGGFHLFSELENEVFLTNPPILYNKKYEFTDNNWWDISETYPEFLIKERVLKNQTSLTSTNNNVQNVQIGEECIKRFSNVFPFSLNEDVIFMEYEASQYPSSFVLNDYLVLSPTYAIPCGNSSAYAHGASQYFNY